MIDRNELQQKFSGIIINTNFTGIYVISPRVGKTRILIESLRGFANWDIIISTPRETINDSWKAELIKWSSNINPVIICNNSLSKQKTSPDLLIIDECHTLSATQINNIISLNPKRLLLMTGTLKKSNELKLIQILKLKTYIKYPIDEAINDGIIADYEINIIKTDLTKEERIVYDVLTKKFNYLSAQSSPSYSKAKMNAARIRMQFIYNSTSKVKVVKEYIGDITERFIIFCSSNVSSEEIVGEYSFNSVSKRNYLLDDFINQKIDKLGVIRMTDMGVSFPNLKLGFIQQIQSNEEIFLQRALRCCNLDRDGRIARLFIFVVKDTVDEKWLDNCLKDVNKERIKYLN